MQIDLALLRSHLENLFELVEVDCVSRLSHLLSVLLLLGFDLSFGHVLVVDYHLLSIYISLLISLKWNADDLREVIEVIEILRLSEDLLHVHPLSII